MKSSLSSIDKEQDTMFDIESGKVIEKYSHRVVEDVTLLQLIMKSDDKLDAIKKIQSIYNPPTWKTGPILPWITKKDLEEARRILSCKITQKL